MSNRSAAPMATRVKEADGPPLYEADFYAWAREQAELLRAGRFEELDLQNLIEEVDDLGGSLYRSVRSRVRTIIEHLLKLEHSPARGPRGLWYDTIAVAAERPCGRPDAEPPAADRGGAAEAVHARPRRGGTGASPAW